MATAQEVKDNIDLDITDKIAEESISQTDVGVNMKDTVDFTVQEVGVLEQSKASQTDLDDLSDQTDASVNSLQNQIFNKVEQGDFDNLLSEVLYIENNLSELTDQAAARVNLGLGNVDNTSDLDKPISIATQNALDAISAPMEYSTQLFQSGTNAPNPQTPQIDTITNIVNGGEFIRISFYRTALGTYDLALEYTAATVPVDLTKVAINFGDAVCRITGTQNGVSSFNFKRWEFKTYTPDGVLSDGLLLGNNGGYVNVKIYN